jgi:hypothetical protein
MAAGGEELYEVSQMPQVKAAMLELGKKAARLGIQNEYLEALNAISTKLQTDPLGWGDEYKPRQEGSLVCHAICAPLFVRYVIFEPERKVMILTLKPMPPSLLAQ